MPRCPSCATDVPEQSRFCLACGVPVAPLAASAAVTVALAPPRRSSPSSSSVDEGRFPAGTVLAERYRILGLIGRGGMGEVYRAIDTKLGQLVALKFLPESTAHNERMLARLHGEVRIARQVSHPNVCRVYDIGEYQGSPFLTMEYVDGEDLGSLLRRIGRLPGDKAIEIARRLCAGVAAAHDKGVLHRDLKPANIMIDGRGQVLITDFGLAALAGQVQEGELRSGTPAYMSPEQVAGREVTVRSDIFALGLVLFEMFTGKRAIEDAAHRSAPTSVAALAKDIDPAVERVILRCLAEEPKDRPATALAVAAALPGGDPLAAALAAGETPSPEMVAAAGETAGMPVRAAVLWLAAVVVALGIGVTLGSKVNPLAEIPFENSTDALVNRSRDLLQALGYTEPPADRAWGFARDRDYDNWARSHLETAARRSLRTSGQPAYATFWFRQSSRYLEPVNANGTVDRGDPAPTASGMAELVIDPQGHLLELNAIPPQVEEPKYGASAAADWKTLFAAAGLDPSSFAPAEPKWMPLGGFDTRAAWTGAYPHAPNIPLRIEAASSRGKPVFFRLIAPWTRPERMQPLQTTGGQQAGTWILLGVFTLVLGAAAFLAMRNRRLGRGDTRGAARLAVFVSAVSLLAWACAAHLVPTVNQWLGSIWAVSTALWYAAVYWVLYMALEPYVRRRWPESLIGWARLLGGGFRDPLVGEHILAGVALGLGMQIILYARDFTMEFYGEPGYWDWRPITDAQHAAFVFLDDLRFNLGWVLGFLFLFFLLRALLRRQWLAVSVIQLLFVGATSLASSHPLAEAPFLLLIMGLTLFVLIRYGLLACAVSGIVGDILYKGTPTLDFSAWYSGRTIFAVALILGIAVYAFRTALAGRTMWKGELLEN